LNGDENSRVPLTLPWEVTPTLAVGTPSAFGAGRQAWLADAPEALLADAADQVAVDRAALPAGGAGRVGVDGEALSTGGAEQVAVDPEAMPADGAEQVGVDGDPEALPDGVGPEQVAVDLHPGDPARRWAARAGLPVRAIQRHHALVAAVMAAHGLGPDDQVIGFACDEGGYGTDGATWGGEVLVAGYKGFRRFAHLAYVRCAGTTPARPHRAALAHLHHAGIRWDLDLAPVRACGNRERRVLASQLETGYGCGISSSLSLLLDALRSLTGAAPPPGAAAPFAVSGLNPGDLIRVAVGELRAGAPPDRVAARSRATIAAALAAQARRCAEETGLRTVALAGNAFDDPALTDAVRTDLPGFRVLTRTAPLSVGRLLCAAAG
jgi:hydrogenase maturation protein HypF